MASNLALSPPSGIMRNHLLQPRFSFAPVASLLRQRKSRGSGQALELSVSGMSVLATADLKIRPFTARIFPPCPFQQIAFVDTTTGEYGGQRLGPHGSGPAATGASSAALPRSRPRHATGSAAGFASAPAWWRCQSSCRRSSSRLGTQGLLGPLEAPRLPGCTGKRMVPS
jgi:hypothetical protein